jgi:predicted extracellular nuclease
MILAGLFGQAQVSIDSEFTAWTGSVPDGWVGAKTNIAAADVQPVVEGVDTIGVRLINATTSHKRFTTTAQTVTNGEAYDITIWVRGQGDIRTGLFDERTTGFGYAPYNAYISINNTAWEMHTQTVTVANSSAIAEFIISVNNTAATGLEIDRVTITEGVVNPPMEVSIFEIQNSSAPDGASPLLGQMVITTGIVTAVFPDTSGYFIQDAPGAWNGVFVYDLDHFPSMGDEVTFTSTVSEYFTLTELTSVTGYSVVSSGNALPASVSVGSASAGAEQYEAVLVTAVNSTCTNASAANGQWVIDDGSGPLFVSPLIYDYTATQGTNYDVTGPMYFSFSEWKILPRMLSDIVVATSIGEFDGAEVTVFPNPAHNELVLDLGGLSGRTEYVLTDATGRSVMADVTTSDRGIINVSQLTNGMYVLSLRNAGSVLSTRIIVQH